MNAPLPTALPPTPPAAPEILGDYWPGIQIYYPPVKYAPSLGIYEDLEQAAQRFKKHAWNTTSHTLLFDLEDGCRQKEMSRELLRRELPGLPRKREPRHETHASTDCCGASTVLYKI